MNQTIQNKFSESFGQHRINLLRVLTTAFDNGMLIKLELLEVGLSQFLKPHFSYQPTYNIIPS